jgi:hypothetical protein
MSILDRPVSVIDVALTQLPQFGKIWISFCPVCRRKLLIANEGIVPMSM